MAVQWLQMQSRIYKIIFFLIIELTNHDNKKKINYELNILRLKI